MVQSVLFYCSHYISIESFHIQGIKRYIGWYLILQILIFLQGFHSWYFSHPKPSPCHNKRPLSCHNITSLEYQYEMHPSSSRLRNIIERKAICRLHKMLPYVFDNNSGSGLPAEGHRLFKALWSEPLRNLFFGNILWRPHYGLLD